MKVTAFSSEYVTEENPNGRVILDLDVPADIATFGGQEAVDNYIESMYTIRLREMPKDPSEPPPGEATMYLKEVNGKMARFIRFNSGGGDPDIVEIAREI